MNNDAGVRKVLDIGCGNRKHPGAVGLDINPGTCADVVHDLNQFPYPFKPSEFDEIYADNVIEHLDNVIAVMEEIQRIAKPGALVTVHVPYFRAHWAYIDPTHKHFFTSLSFSYFDPGHIHNKLFPYSKARYKVESVRFNLRINKGVLDGIIKAFANRFPTQYEKRLSHLYPMDELTFQLRAIK